MNNRRGFNPDARVKDAAFAFRVLSDSVFTKGFLGPSLRENRGLPSVGVSSARRAGVIVDENGKMRCPPGTPNANQFTDINMSNCMIPSAETVARNAAEVATNAASRALDGFKRGSIGGGKDRDKIPNAGVGFANPDGFLEQRRIPKGNSVSSPIDGSQRQLNAVEDSIQHIFDGGPLSDIPDEHLVRSIMSNASEEDLPEKRFQIVGTGGGIKGMTRLKDKKTGALIGVKYDDGKSESTSDAAREVAAELLAEHMGYEPMPMRIVLDIGESSWGGESYRGGALVTELAHNRHAGTIESGRISDRDGKYEYKVEPSDIVRMKILDSIIQNNDRHEGNFLISRDENGNGRLIPIDHNAGMATSDNKQDAQYITKPPSQVGIDEVFSVYFQDGGDAKLLADVEEIQQSLADVDTAKLREQFEQLFQHLAIHSMGLTQQEKDDIFSALDRLTIMANPENAKVITSAMLPEYKRPKPQPSTIGEWVEQPEKVSVV